MKEITKDIICECSLFLGKVILIGTVICGTAYVGYNYWYVNHFTPEERQMIEEMRRKSNESERSKFIYTTANYVNDVCTEKEEECESNFSSKLKSELSPINFQVAVIAETLWREARGEGREGIEGVASVILNRMKERNMSGADVCLEKWQFTCWHGKRVSPSDNFWKKDRSKMSDNDKKIWDMCVGVALKIVYGKYIPKISANHYYNPSKCRPSWGRKMRKVCYIGRHKFGRV